MSVKVLGIDTSNYTTSVALVEDGKVVYNFKKLLSVGENERGIRQSDALFHHTKNLPELFEKLKNTDLSAVSVSVRPRDVEGSYMPCFLAGYSTASAIANVNGINCHTVSHQAGHVMAALYSSGRLDLKDGKFIAFHVSGGTTEMLLVDPEKDGFSVKLLGGSVDLHAGQAVDRIGVALGLSFPCGPALERLAMSNTKKIPRPRISVRDGSCNLSGLENLALDLYRKTNDKALTAAFVLRFLSKTLTEMAQWLRLTHGELPILFSGGVMSNRIIAKELREQLGEVYFAEPAFSADNAAGIALLCRAQLLQA